MFRKIRNTGLVLLLIMYLISSVGGNESSADQSGQAEGWQDNEITYVDTDADSDDDYDDDYEDADEEGVYIPEDTYVVRYNGDRDQLYLDMYQATSLLSQDVCLIGGSFDRADMYDMNYSGFWIRDYSTRTEYGTDTVTGEPATYTFYNFTYDDGLTCTLLDEQKAAVDAAADEIIAAIPLNADRWTQIRIVHDELCRRITFDKAFVQPHRYDVYGALINHIAVCNGYTCAFNHIMSRLGMDTHRVYSETHAWNSTGVPSTQEYIDITWDDTDTYDEYGREYVNYAYLFLTYDEMESVDEHQDISGEPYAYMDDPVIYNYHMHEGYYIYDYTWDDLVSKMRRQYESGTNMMTVRFASRDDYEKVKQWDGSGRTEFVDLLRELNYTGNGIYTWYKDDVMTLSIGLYPPPQ